MFSLQSSQIGILTYCKNHPQSTTFHHNMVVEVKGHINISAFTAAIVETTRRHDALRSYIPLNNKELAQLVHPAENLNLSTFTPFFVLDASQLPYTEPSALDATLKKLQATSILHSPFNLEVAPLWRTALVKFNETTYQFLLIAHHIITDKTSTDILFNDISSYYNAFLNNTQPNLPTVPPLDERLTLNPDEATTHFRLSHWQEKLKKLNIVRLPVALKKLGPFSFQGKRHYFNIKRKYLNQLEQQFPSLSINNIMLGCLGTLIYRYTGEHDVCIGITSANRHHQIPGISSNIIENNLVSCLFNSLPIRFSFDPNISFAQLLLHIKEETKQSLKNQLSLETIYQEALSHETKRDLHTASPFSIMLTTNKRKATLTLNGTHGAHPCDLNTNGNTKFSDFGINLDQLDDGSQAGFIEYNTQRFDEPSIQRIIKHLISILKTVTDQPHIPIKNIYLLQPEELQKIMAYNNTSHSSTFLALPDALHQISKKIPNQPAVRFHANADAGTLSFLELDIQSTKLANYLLSCGCQPGQPIGVCLPRSLDIVIVIFGVFKAGMILVTLETERDKLNFIQAKIEPLDLIITDNETKAFFPEKNIINLYHENTNALIQSMNDVYVKQNIDANSPAYIMYSSGTTGTPKGTLNTHGGLSNLLSDLANKFPHDSSSLNRAPFTFDASLFELLLLALGNTLHLTNNNSPTYLSQLIKEHRIGILVLLPPVLKELDPVLPSVTHVVTMGTIPDRQDLAQRKKANPECTFQNGFGPTEYTICTSFHTISDNPNLPDSLIGQPIQNTKIFIIDDDGALCPIGIPGQLVITGAGIAQGYTNNPEQNQNSFKTLRFDDSNQRLIPATLDESGAMRCYLTGDIGCYYAENDKNITINFISRKNREYKIHGALLVNLDMLQETLRKHPDVRDVFIHVKNEALCAFIIPKDLDQTNDELKLRRSLCAFLLENSTLPRASYPRDVIILREFILNNNGKIDASSLPHTEASPAIPLNFSELRPLEAEILHLWSQLLDLPIDQIDFHESFHMNGGDSILIVQLESKLNNHPRFEFTPHVTVDELLNTTIEALTNLLEPRCTARPSKLLIQHSIFNSNTMGNTTPADDNNTPHPPRNNIP
ncbi:MAG TPA: AMP-binding protein [Gammaproteobacteria bacterium]|jgi:non-ribosomal peptide synthetase component F|nr:AMP-binding protein [Gammaproteobacteria bacterium]